MGAFEKNFKPFAFSVYACVYAYRLRFDCAVPRN